MSHRRIIETTPVELRTTRHGRSQHWSWSLRNLVSNPTVRDLHHYIFGQFVNIKAILPPEIVQTLWEVYKDKNYAYSGYVEVVFDFVIYWCQDKNTTFEALHRLLEKQEDARPVLSAESEMNELRALETKMRIALSFFDQLQEITPLALRDKKMFKNTLRRSPHVGVDHRFYPEPYHVIYGHSFN